jgi:uncharacterized protein (TIGR03067 family)
MSLLSVLVSTLGLVLGAEDAAQDQQKMQGTWQVVSAAREGKEMPEELRKTLRFVVKDDTITIKGRQGGEGDKATFKLDPGKTPKTIDLLNPQHSQSPIQGIYEIKGDTLRFCMGRPGQARPAEFPAKPGNDVRLMVLQREKTP